MKRTQLWLNNKLGKFLLLEIKLRLRIFQEIALDYSPLKARFPSLYSAVKQHLKGDIQVNQTFCDEDSILNTSLPVDR